MAGIDRINDTIARLQRQTQSKLTSKSSSPRRKEAPATSNKPRSNQSTTSQLKTNIHLDLQSIDLGSAAGREQGRRVFVEHALLSEFGDGVLTQSATAALITKIEHQFSLEPQIRSELDSLIKSLQRSKRGR